MVMAGSNAALLSVAALVVLVVYVVAEEDCHWLKGAVETTSCVVIWVEINDLKFWSCVSPQLRFFFRIDDVQKVMGDDGSRTTLPICISLTVIHNFYISHIM